MFLALDKIMKNSKICQFLSNQTANLENKKMRKTRLDKDLKKENAAKRLRKLKTKKERRKQDKEFKNGVCKSLYSGTFKTSHGVI